MNENQMTFQLCKRITELRKELGYTQEMLANKLGITYQAVSKWENGLSFPDITILPVIADIFAISIDDLFGRTKEIKASSNNSFDVLPWEDDDTLRAVLFQGKYYIPTGNNIGNDRRSEFKFIYEGDALDIQSEISIECNNCSIAGNLSAGANITCTDIEGSAHAGASITCTDIKGNADAGASINCTDIKGNAEAGATINCSDVGGKAEAGCNIYCGDVGGNVKAGNQVTCGDVTGDVICQGNVQKK